MRVFLMAVAVLGLMAFAAAPPPPPADDGGEVFVRPDWARRPSGDDIARHYPYRAWRQEVSGKATIVCTVAIDGRVRNCQVTEESPEGLGFGEAAVSLSEEFRMTPARRNGRPVEAEIRIPVVFNLPEGGTPIEIGFPEFKGSTASAGLIMILLGLGLGAGVLGALLLILRSRRDEPTDI